MNKPVKQQERSDIEAILGMEASSRLGWMQHQQVKWAAAALAGLLLLATAWSFVGSDRAIHYVTEPATRGNLVVIVTATGSVQPTNKVDVSSELSGTIRKVLVDYNSPVTAGQRLAELDTDKLQATVDSSRAKLVAAKAKVADAEATAVEKERDLARKKSLAEKQYTSTQDLDLAQAAYDRAVANLASVRADVGVAEADLKLNETNLGKACICSPIKGVVLERNVDPGQIVASSFQAPVLFSIAEDLKQMELQVDVDEADVGKVRIGQNASFSVDAFPDRKFPATIRDVRFASETIQGVVTYKAVLDIDNSELLLRPGMTATAEIKATEIADALLVPNAALRFTPVSDTAGNQSLLRRFIPGPPQFRPASQPEETGPNRTVWVLRNGDPTPVKVVIGLSDGKRTELPGGEVQVGQALIVDQTTSTP
jgi:HlyD family secretion protein